MTDAATIDALVTRLNAGHHVTIPPDVVVCVPGGILPSQVPQGSYWFYEYHDDNWYLFLGQQRP